MELGNPGNKSAASEDIVSSDVACTVCGCVCDDLRLTVRGQQIVDAEGACSLSRDWFLQQHTLRPATAEFSGQAIETDAAVTRAVRILAKSKRPLIYGLSRSSTSGQRAAIRLAEQLGACVDTTASLCHAPSVMAIQEVGESTSSLGEIRNRADLVIFWGVDPVVSHPRHLERYSAEPVGMFLPGGRADRTLVVIDAQETATSELADQFIRVPAGRDFEAIWTLRALINDVAMQDDVLEDAPEDAARRSLPHKQLVELARRMRACRVGVVFFGLGLSRAASGHRNVEALLRLVTDLNACTRFHARRMRIPGDVTGADSVLCWQTGFPFSVDLSRGYPRYNPGEYSVNEILERGEADCCLMVGSEGITQMSAAAVDHLRNIPTIFLDHPTIRSAITPTLRFTTGVYGIHFPGTAYRMDEVPIPLRNVLPAEYPSDAEILERLGNQLARR